MRLLPLIVLFVACSPTGEGVQPDKKQAAERHNPPESQRFKAEPIDLAQAHFYAHEPEQQTTRETLELDEFKVSISTAPGTVRTRIDAVIRNPSDRQKQARIRLPIPEDAAVVNPRHTSRTQWQQWRKALELLIAQPEMIGHP